MDWEILSFNERSTQRRVQVRKDLISVLKTRFNNLLVTESIVQQQVLCLNSIIDVPSEIDIEIVEDSISHLNNLFRPRESLDIVNAAPVVINTLQTIVNSAKLPGRDASILSNKSRVGFLGDPSHVAGLILNLTSTMSLALLNNHVAGEFHLALKSNDITLWTKRESMGGSYNINLDRNLDSHSPASITFNTSLYNTNGLEKIDICAAALDLHYKNSVSNAVISIEIFDGDKKQNRALEWKGLQVPIQLNIPLSPLFNSTVKHEQALCSYWDNAKKSW